MMRRVLIVLLILIVQAIVAAHPQISLAIYAEDGSTKPCYRNETIVLKVSSNSKLQSAIAEIKTPEGIVKKKLICEGDACNGAYDIKIASGTIEIDVNACDASDCSSTKKIIIVDTKAPKVENFFSKQVEDSLNISFEVDETAELVVRLDNIEKKYKLTTKKFSEAIKIDDINKESAMLEIIIRDACGNETRVIENKKIFPNVKGAIESFEKKIRDLERKYHKLTYELFYPTKDLNAKIAEIEKLYKEAIADYNETNYEAMGEKLEKITEKLEKIRESIKYPVKIYETQIDYTEKALESISRLNNLYDNFDINVWSNFSVKRRIIAYLMDGKVRYVNEIILKPSTETRGVFYVSDIVPKYFGEIVFYEGNFAGNSLYIIKVSVKDSNEIVVRYASELKNTREFKILGNEFEPIGIFKEAPLLREEKIVKKELVIGSFLVMFGIYIIYRRLRR